MSERWETVPVSREVRKALMDWADDEAAFGEGSSSEQRIKVAARQFREDVLAVERSEPVDHHPEAVYARKFTASERERAEEQRQRKGSPRESS